MGSQFKLTVKWVYDPFQCISSFALCVYLCMCVCACACAYVYCTSMYAFVWFLYRGPRLMLVSSSISLYFIYQRMVFHWTQSLLLPTNPAGYLPCGFPFSTSTVLGLQVTAVSTCSHEGSELPLLCWHDDHFFLLSPLQFVAAPRSCCHSSVIIERRTWEAMLWASFCLLHSRRTTGDAKRITLANPNLFT